MAEEEDQQPLTIIRTDIEVLTSRTLRLSNQLRGQRRFITSELNAQDNRINALNNRNQVLEAQLEVLRRQNTQQAEQIASITSQVHLLTNQVDFLLATLRQVQPEQEQPAEEQVDNSAQE